MQEIRLSVEGMKCEGCESRVENAIGTLDGVKSVEANHNENTVKVVADDSVFVKEVADCIADLDYIVGEIITIAL